MYRVLSSDWLVNTTINSHNGMSTYKATTCGLAFWCSGRCIKTCAVFSSLSRGHLTKCKRPILISEYEMLTSTSITFSEMLTHAFYFFSMILSSCKALGAGFIGIKPYLDPPHGTLISIKPGPQRFYRTLNSMDWLEHVLCVYT
jgi:hypothetical protein